MGAPWFRAYAVSHELLHLLIRPFVSPGPLRVTSGSGVSRVVEIAARTVVVQRKVRVLRGDGRRVPAGIHVRGDQRTTHSTAAIGKSRSRAHRAQYSTLCVANARSSPSRSSSPPPSASQSRRQKCDSSPATAIHPSDVL